MNGYITLFDPIEQRIADNICRLLHASGLAGMDGSSAQVWCRIVGID